MPLFDVTSKGLFPARVPQIGQAFVAAMNDMYGVCSGAAVRRMTNCFAAILTTMNG